jgi:hypothetical protein
MINQINWKDGSKTFRDTKGKIITKNENEKNKVYLKALSVLAFLELDPEYKKEFLNYSLSEQKTAVKLLIALKKI